MRIEIETITDTDPSAIMVGFRSAAGSARAQWAKWAPLAQIGRSYDVELDIDDPILLGTNATRVSPRAPSIQSEHDETTFVIAIESKDYDGMLCARLAPDCIILIEQADDEIDAGDFIELRVASKNLRLSPFG